MQPVNKASTKKGDASKKYVDDHEPVAKEHHLEKLLMVSGKDPSELDKLSEDENVLSAVTYADTMNCLVLSPSSYR